ncbi:hypothetical protein ACXR2U_13195 [Jatrophihabitans sp. YIM 134969]
MTDTYVDALPARDYQEFEAEAGACEECQGFDGGWRWTSVPFPVHYNCGCNLSTAQVDVTDDGGGTDTVGDTEELQWVATVPRGGSASRAQTWSTGRSWVVYPKISGTKEVGGIKVGGEIGGSYGGQDGSSHTDTTTFTYQNDIGGADGQQVYARYKVRTQQDYEKYTYHWGDVTNDSGDETLKLRKGAPYTERKFAGYVNQPIAA